MAVFLVSFDLMRGATGFDYSPFVARLRELGAVQALSIVWLVESRASAVALQADLSRHLHDEDRLIVAQLDRRPECRNIASAADRLVARGFDRRGPVLAHEEQGRRAARR